MLYNIEPAIFIKMLISLVYILVLLEYFKDRIESGMTTYKDFYALLVLTLFLIIVLLIY